MRREALLLLLYSAFVVSSALATGHGALVMTDPLPRFERGDLVTAGHLADDPLIQAKVIAALARFEAETIEELESREVVSSLDREMGDIEAIAVSQTSSELIAIVSLDGFGLANMKEVALPLREVLPKDRFRVMVPYTKTELQAMEDIDLPGSELDALGD